MKKVLALIMAMALLLSLVGCGARTTVTIDSNKTTLTVGVWNGGPEDDWLQAAIQKFEEKYADVSFEEGKKGVQVIIGSCNKTTMEGETLKNLILTADNKDEVFFTEGVFYQYWASTGRMLDITQYVNEKLTEFGEDKSIADKMDASLKEAMTMDGKIYAIPYWQGQYCMVYNATLFDEEGWYYDANGNFTDAKGTLGTGPDGKTGTYDDGLPRTYDEFFRLLDRINQDNATPIQWPGASQDYMSWLMAELAADYIGAEEFNLNYTFDGTATLVKNGTFNWDTLAYETEEVAINRNNAYELARQPGLAMASAFVERLVQNTSYYDINNCLSGSFKITQSQLEFVRNPTVSAKKNVAIMVDGNWWEAEATASFKETYGTNATKYDSEMDYKYMPFPKATEAEVGKQMTMVGSPLDSYCFIKSNIDPAKIELATTFLQFVHTDAQMAEFTEMTGLPKPYTYDYDESKLTSFGASMMNAMQASTIVWPMDDNELYRYAPSDFRLVKWMRCKYAADKDASDCISDVLTALNNGEYLYSAEDYFKGIYNFRKTTQWEQYDSILG